MVAFLDVFEGKGAEVHDEPARHGPEGPGEESYQKKVGKWIAEARSSLRDKQFWQLIHVGRLARQPLTHLLAWTQKPDDPDADPRPKLVRLIGGKAQELATEWDMLVIHPASSERIWRPVVSL
eukprot:600811-Pyramimonas_sp.AAC.1